MCKSVRLPKILFWPVEPPNYFNLIKKPHNQLSWIWLGSIHENLKNERDTCWKTTDVCLITSWTPCIWNQYTEKSCNGNFECFSIQLKESLPPPTSLACTHLPNPHTPSYPNPLGLYLPATTTCSAYAHPPPTYSASAYAYDSEWHDPSVTLTRCLFATGVELPSFIFLVSYSWSASPGLIFLVLSPFRFQMSGVRSHISCFIFQISDFRCRVLDIVDARSWPEIFGSDFAMRMQGWESV